MPEITVTETQRETLDDIRSDLTDAYIDSYGQIRTQDVVQYLLDTYTPPAQETSDEALERIGTAEFPLLQKIAAGVEDVPGSGIDTETMRGELLSTLGVEEFALRLREIEPDSDNAASENGAETTSDEATGTTNEPGGDQSDAEQSRAQSDADGDSEPSSTSETQTEDPSSGASASGGGTKSNSAGRGPPSGGSESILSAANQLLTEHDDKWREGDDGPYEVDLPDGTTETVRTKDDIRQRLFKHY